MENTDQIIETPPGWKWQGDIMLRLDTIIALERGQHTSVSGAPCFTATAWLSNGTQREIVNELTVDGRDTALNDLAGEVSLAVGLARYEEENEASA